MGKFALYDKVTSKNVKWQMTVLEYQVLTLAMDEKRLLEKSDNEKVVLCGWFAGKRYRQAWFRECDLFMFSPYDLLT